MMKLRQKIFGGFGSDRAGVDPAERVAAGDLGRRGTIRPQSRAVLVLGEIIKVTLVGQVIEIAKPKLMSFRWFAWAYGHWEAVMDRLRSIKAWQAVRRQFHSIVARVRRTKAQRETPEPAPPDPPRPGSSR